MQSILIHDVIFVVVGSHGSGGGGGGIAFFIQHRLVFFFCAFFTLENTHRPSWSRFDCIEIITLYLLGFTWFIQTQRTHSGPHIFLFLLSQQLFRTIGTMALLMQIFSFFLFSVASHQFANVLSICDCLNQSRSTYCFSRLLVHERCWFRWFLVHCNCALVCKMLWTKTRWDHKPKKKNPFMFEFHFRSTESISITNRWFM